MHLHAYHLQYSYRARTSETIMSICLRSLWRVLMRSSGSLWMPTQHPFTKIFVALGGEERTDFETMVKV